MNKMQEADIHINILNYLLTKPFHFFNLFQSRSVASLHQDTALYERALDIFRSVSE